MVVKALYTICRCSGERCMALTGASSTSLPLRFGRAFLCQFSLLLLLIHNDSIRLLDVGPLCL